MPEFLFAATDAAGKSVQGKAAADDMSVAVAQISSMGYTLLHIELSASPAPGLTDAPGSEPQPSTPIALQPAAAAEPPSPPKDLLKSDADRRRKLEQELVALGMSPDEIKRLINANANTTEADTGSMPMPVAIPSHSKPGAPATSASKGRKVTASSLESFAAQLTTDMAAKNKATVSSVNLGLPAFRESTTAEVIQAEALLREASMLRRREKFRDAEQKAREAIALTPKDPAALELLGDILQGVARVDEALSAYKRATEADPKRGSAERKYGDLLMRQQNWNFADPEAVAPNRWLNTILSLCPGLGQVYNGEIGKAIVFFCLDALCVGLLFWAVDQKVTRVSPLTISIFGLTFATYIAAMIDSNISAAKRRLR